MKITIEVPDPPTPELVAALADLMARIGPDASVATDDEWTVDRAVKLLRDTNARTTLLLEAAIEGDGFADGQAFREKYGDNALRGPSQSITKAIKRGAEQGHWSASIAQVLKPTTPDKEGWSKTGGYYLAEGLIPVFREAIRRMRATGVLGPPGYDGLTDGGAES
ncbi:hypothetical protein ACFTXM_08790 [Streptomyces sp. NPDC056930]|uniref:hypothetical protein n=1 Tax=Streptomyces sp. NPDC056930 TaxID=3345967 RepID=UPI0036367C1E